MRHGGSYGVLRCTWNVARCMKAVWQCVEMCAQLVEGCAHVCCCFEQMRGEAYARLWGVCVVAGAAEEMGMRHAHKGAGCRGQPFMGLVP